MASAAEEPSASALAATPEHLVGTDGTTITAAPERAEVACITIQTLGGGEVGSMPVPPTVRDLKTLIAKSGYMPVALQKLLHAGSLEVCSDEELLEPVNQAMVLVQDESPLWCWALGADVAQLNIEGGVITCSDMKSDYVNVITQEPMSAGLHYFEFHLHHYGDEQWCGVTPDSNMAGKEYEKAVPSKTGYMYYTGRGEGALEAKGVRLKRVSNVPRTGSVIGMLVDCDGGSAAFDLDGVIQGACEVPKKTPLWVLTHVDTRSDHVELRKPSWQDAPPANFEALKGALLDVSQGTVISRSY